MDRLPVLFVGHGSPMNAIEDNPFTRQWETLGETLPRPAVILCISAHWFTAGTRVTDSTALPMVYDMYGFPEALYQLKYPAPGSPKVAKQIHELLPAQIDNSWGLDHGSWSVLRRMFPKADIPVLQLSVDRQATPQQHFALGQTLRVLRSRGVLIVGSGNVVHNLALLNPGMPGGYPWAESFDTYIKDSVVSRKFDRAVHYRQAGEAADYSFRTIDHYAPLLYVLGAADDTDSIAVFNNACMYGSMSMTGYLFA